MVEGRGSSIFIPYYVWIEMPKFWILLNTLETMKAAGFFLGVAP